MISLIRTDSTNPDFVVLVRQLDADLSVRDGDDHSFYNQFNKIDAIRHVIVAYDGDAPVACGAIKAFSEDAMEIKRMYTAPNERGKGIAGMVLTELEHWAGELSYKKCVLETGKKQPEAIALYTRQGYQVTENYGQYLGVENSVCFAKNLAI
jgi:GNAT superfamily N-acetyltransferase